jgi:predicted peroxiredoxin
LVVLGSDSGNAARRALRYAATAAAMDLTVELHVISAEAVCWVARDAADSTLLAQVRQACGLGVALYVCPAALAEHGLTRAQLIDEVNELRGAASLLAAAMAPNVRVLSF